MSRVKCFVLNRLRQVRLNGYRACVGAGGCSCSASAAAVVCPVNPKSRAASSWAGWRGESTESAAGDGTMHGMLVPDALGSEDASSGSPSAVANASSGSPLQTVRRRRPSMSGSPAAGAGRRRYPSKERSITPEAVIAR